MNPAIVLLSGGLDSATVLAIAQSQGFEPIALSFRYGQRHAIEIDAACKIAAARGVSEHHIVDIDLRSIGGSALTADIAVPKNRSSAEIASDRHIPSTYVPARNTIFLSFALAWAEVRGAADIFVGINAIDYSGYPDCRPDYLAAFETLARLATRAGVEGCSLKIHAPLMQLSKPEIIRRGLSLGVDYGLTTSCYDPSAMGGPCMACDSCRLRQDAFAAVGMPDPASK